MSDTKAMKNMLGNMFMEIADAIETGQFGNKVKVAPNSVVMRKTKDDSFYMGNPARKTIL